MSQPRQQKQKHVKQRRRRMLTFWRMCRYGVNNFSRNAWLTIAATAVMAVTLLIIFMTIAARQVLVSTVEEVSRKTEISLYLKGSTEQKIIDEMRERLTKLDNVTGVRYISPQEARQEQIESLKGDPEALEAIKESENKMPATLRVTLKDLSNRGAVEHFIAHDEAYSKHNDPTKKPSSSNERRSAINTISGWVRFASIGGSIATIVFVIISSLVVFNTIRMAIFHRKDEIQMMKLIGADRGFIRGPFIVEAIMYGFIAAIVATGIGYGLIRWAEAPLSRWLPMRDLIAMMTTYIGIILLAMIAVGSLIGIMSSLVATRKYLKL